MKIVVDWTVPIMALLSLFISVLTLYLAHLRGPVISLVIPGEPYPIAKTRDEPNFHHKVTINVLIANTGNRPGFLYHLNISSADKIYSSTHFDPPVSETLPTTLVSGAWYKVRCTMVFRLSSEEEWREFLTMHEMTRIFVMYSCSTTFRSRVTKKRLIEIDLAHIARFYQQ